MLRIVSSHGHVWPIGIAAALGLFGGGCSSDRSYRPRPDRTNVVQRPTYEDEGTKTLYLGGYAGADYDYGARPGR
jgi:hypothetical protein